MAAQPSSAAAASAGPALQGGASRQYWGRAGRMALWDDINVDEYTSGCWWRWQPMLCVASDFLPCVWGIGIQGTALLCGCHTQQRLRRKITRHAQIGVIT